MELLAHSVRRVATPDDLQLPGDYCVTDHIELSGRECRSIIINCPFCRAANAVPLPQARIRLMERLKNLFRPKTQELTLAEPVACYGNPERHRFGVRGDIIIPAYA